MLSIDFIRKNKQKVEKSATDKGYKINIDKLLEVDGKRRQLTQEVQQFREELKKTSKKGIDESSREEAKQKRDKIQQMEISLKKIESEWKNLIYEIPNLSANDVKVGKDESENEVIKKHGQPLKLDFKPKDHLELGTELDIIDVERAVKISGTRFGYLKNEAALLEFALVQLAFKTFTQEGFTPIVPPVLIKKEITEGLGYWQAGGSEDYYLIKEPHQQESSFYLVGTAEHSIVPMHKGETFEKKDLPKRYIGFSSCFRREAGSYGKDVRGIFRVHQFDKVEMVSFTTEEEDNKEHEYFLSLEEKLFQALDIPYQVVKMCTGDLGFPVARKYDLEAWIPSQNKYREVTSTSTTTDFQARRLNIKYKDGDEKKYARILNGTVFAIGRTLIAILENYQQKDGSVKIPKVLQPFTGFSEIKKKNA